MSYSGVCHFDIEVFYVELLPALFYVYCLLFQPALLYLVPACTSFPLLTALIKGEIKEMFRLVQPTITLLCKHPKLFTAIKVLPQWGQFDPQTFYWHFNSHKCVMLFGGGGGWWPKIQGTYSALFIYNNLRGGVKTARKQIVNAQKLEIEIMER